MAGDRKSGIRWFLLILLLWLIKIVASPLQSIPGVIAFGGLTLIIVIFYCILLVRSYRPVPKIGFGGWIVFLIISFGLLVSEQIVAQLFFSPFRMPTSSMTPTIQPGDFIFTQNNAYWFSPPKRGDLVVFSTDDIPGLDQLTDTFFVKRIAALPEETVEIEDGKLFIDGQPITEPAALAKDHFTPRAFRPDSSVTNRFYVPADHYFVIGDNAPNSNDSRYFGPIPEDNILGKVTKIYWPLGHITDLQ